MKKRVGKQKKSLQADKTLDKVKVSYVKKKTGSCM